MVRYAHTAITDVPSWKTFEWKLTRIIVFVQEKTLAQSPLSDYARFETANIGPNSSFYGYQIRLGQIWLSKWWVASFQYVSWYKHKLSPTYVALHIKSIHKGEKTYNTIGDNSWDSYVINENAIYTACTNAQKFTTLLHSKYVKVKIIKNTSKSIFFKLQFRSPPPSRFPLEYINFGIGTEL